MLVLPPKLKAAFDRGDFQPVVTARITTEILDAPPAQQTKSYYRTVEGSEGVELLYPAQPGDPVQTAVLYRDGFTDRVLHTIKIAPRREWPFITDIMPTFTVPENVAVAKAAKTIKIKATRFSGIAGFELRCRLYLADPAGHPVNLHTAYGSGGILRGGQGIDAANVIGVETIPASPTPAELTFNFGDNLIPGQKYAPFFYLVQTIGSFSGNSAWPRIGIYGSEQPRLGEFLRSVVVSEDRFVLQDLPGTIAMQVDVAAYTNPPVTGNPETDYPWVDYAINLNGTPVSAGVIDMIDFRPSWIDPVTGARQETDISYQLWAGASLGAKTTDLGAVVAGDRVTALSQYYVLRARPRTANTTTHMRTPVVKKVNLLFAQVFAGAPKSYLLSSAPFPGAIPAIARIPSTPTRLDPRNHLTQRASWRLELTDPSGDVTRFLTETHLLNRPVELRFGHRPDAASEDDLVPLAAGKIIDYAYEEGRPYLTIEDRSKDLSVKIPKPTAGNLQRRDWQYKNLVDVLEEIEANEAEISRRWIDTASFAEHKTYLKGVDAESKWITHHIASDPEEARDMAEKILQIIGAHQAALEDGRLRLIRFPKSGNSVRTWDADILSVEESQPDGFARTLINQCLVTFQFDAGGENLGIALYLDDDAQNDWAPGAERFRSDRLIEAEKWLGPEIPFNGKTIAERVARREVRTHKDGMIPKKCQTSIFQYEVQVGDLIDVTSPVFLRRYELGTNGKQFQVTGKDPRIEQGIIEWELVEAIQVNRLPTASFTVNVDIGTPPFTVNFNGSGSVDPDGAIVLYEWDFDYDGVNFTTDATGVTSSHEYGVTAGGVKLAALRITDDAGGFHIATRQIRVRTAPVAVILFDISAPDQPLFAVLTSGSYGITGAIVKTEWDLSYNGSFLAEVIGETAVLNLPYQSVTVALRVTDQDGLTDIETITLEGKAFAPADVTGFYVDQVGDKLVLRWDENLETDLYAYEVREGATWNTSTIIAAEILTNSFTTVAPTQPGSKTYLVKAINTTGRKSINATATTRTIFDTHNRNVLVSVDRKATGWPGTKTGLVYEVAGDRWWIGSTGDLVSDMTTPVSGMTTPVALRGTRTSGTYEGPAIDLGGIVEGNRLSIPISTELTPDPEGVSAKVEYAESDDGSSYSAFAQISQSDLGFRHVKEKITLSNDDGASNIALQDVDVIIDVPDVFDSGEDEVIPVGGKTVSYNRTFNAVPAITAITIQNMTVSLYAKVTAKTKTGFTVQIFRASDNVDVGATIDWAAKGY